MKSHDPDRFVFEPHVHFWWVLRYSSSGHIRDMEEHDHYAGGGVTKPADKTWEEYFVQSVVRRGFKAEQAEAFLKECREKILK